MTNRLPTTNLQNIFSDSEQVDNTDLSAEQLYNDTVNSDIIGNHIGSGTLPEVLVPSIIFDTDTVTSLYKDGIALYPTVQPSDSDLGNQLEIVLSSSKASAKKTVKVAVFGTDFQGAIQYETFRFRRNETQITYKHYTKVYLILLNDFIGTEGESLNLGGRIIISEVKPFSISRDCIMVSQDYQPNLFFRDFYLPNPISLNSFLTSALARYSVNVDDLNITSDEADVKQLLPNDVSSQIGEKFQATTNNIQKITLLMSVSNDADPTDLVWTGDLVISVYALQTTLSCVADIPPGTQIEYTPSPIPLAQLSYNYTTLQAAGTTLTTVAQPVDFVFSNTSIANGKIVPGSYYCVTAKRSGSPTSCNLEFATGTNSLDTQRLTMFSGTTWVDVPEFSLWFQCWTDSVKVSDGQAYESGFGIALPKVMQESGVNSDYVLHNVQFYGTNELNAVLFSNVESSVPIQDQRTGNDVFSRKSHVPDIRLLTSLETSSLEDPTILGIVADKNVKALNNPNIDLSFPLKNFSFVNNVVYIKYIEDISDGYYSQSDYSTIGSLLNGVIDGSIINSRFFPNSYDLSTYFRVSSADIIEQIYGDVNGDGIIDSDDLVAIDDVFGFNLNTSPITISNFTISLPSISVIHGYEFFTKQSITETGLTFYLCTGTNILSLTSIANGTDGVLTASTSAGDAIVGQSGLSATISTFSSTTGVTTVTGLTLMTANSVGRFLVITNAADSGNNGTFRIINYNSATSVDIDNIFANASDGNNGSIHWSEHDTLTINENESTFTSTAVDFNTYAASLSGAYIVVTTGTNLENNGAYRVVSYTASNNSLIIKKTLYTEESVLQAFRSDLDDDYIITTTDETLLNDYVSKVAFSPSTTDKSPYVRIGEKFRVIKLILESFNDRDDDYYTTLSTRAEEVHSFTPPPTFSAVISGQTGSAAKVASISSGVATITGLTGMTLASVGRTLTISGAINIHNNGTFNIVSYISATSVGIDNSAAVVITTFSLSWTENVSYSSLDIFNIYYPFQNRNFHTSSSTSKITKQLYWTESSVLTKYDTKYICTIFGSDKASSVSTGAVKDDQYPLISSSGTKVDYYFPGDVILDGEILRATGSFYKPDFEIGIVNLQMPVELYSSLSGTTATISAYSSGTVTITGLVGMTAGHVGRTITISNADTTANNGTFIIKTYNSSTSVDYTNTSGSYPDAAGATINWSVNVERSLNVFESFIYDYTGDGRTEIGYPAMKFADGTYVPSTALENNQVQFDVSAQSFSPKLTPASSYDVTMDGSIGVNINYVTGELTLNFTNLKLDPAYKTVDTKIQMVVYLKKSGFNNKALLVDHNAVKNLLI